MNQNILDIPIFHKIYCCYKKFYFLKKTFPKDIKYSLGKKCDECFLEIIKATILASQTRNLEKLNHLKKASAEFNLLKILIYLLKDLDALSGKQYQFFEQNFVEIGKMFGGWIKNTKKR